MIFVNVNMLIEKDFMLIKNTYIIFRLLIFTLILNPFMGFGQTPDVCATTTDGYAFFPNTDRINVNPLVCLNESQLQGLTNLSFQSNGFYSSFHYAIIQDPNIDEVTDIQTSIQANQSNAGGLYTYSASTTNNTPGKYYILAYGTKGGVRYKGCKTLDVLFVERPKVNIEICPGTNPSVTFLGDTSYITNYEITWTDASKTNLTRAQVDANPKVSSPIAYQPGSISVKSTTANGFCVSNSITKSSGVPDNTYIDSLIMLNEGTSAHISFSDYTTDKEYTIEYAIDGSTPNWQTAGTAKNGKFDILAGLQKGNSYCFRIKNSDDCGAGGYSNIVCGMGLDINMNSTTSATITWNLPSSNTNNDLGTGKLYKISFDSFGTTLNQNIYRLDSRPSKTLNEVNLNCNNTYEYYINLSYRDPGINKQVYVASAKYLLDPKKAATAAKPNAWMNVSYNANDESLIKIIVNNTTGVDFDFYRSSADNPDFISIGQAASNDFDDISIIPESGAYCYKYSYVDECGVTSLQSSAFCTVYLSGNGSTLNWTPYSFPADVVTSSQNIEYSIEVYDENVDNFITVATTDNTDYNIYNYMSSSNQAQLKFRILAKQFINGDNFTNQFVFSYSNVYIINIPPAIYVPSAFTPNFDGSNDAFALYTKFIKEGSMNIYDRWGGILFQTDNLSQGWNGTMADQVTPAPVGNYTYRIKGTSEAGEKFDMSGSIMLIR